MKLNIEKLKDKLNNISSEVSYDIKKRFHKELKNYFNVITFNHLIKVVYVEDYEDIKRDINGMTYFTIASFSMDDFNNMRATLDFIENNEQAIKTAILESIEEKEC